MGEMVYETVLCSMKPMLNPALTASWEKGLEGIYNGSVNGKEYRAKLSEQEYLNKLNDFVTKRTNMVKQNDYRNALRSRFDYVAPFYKTTKKDKKNGRTQKK